MCYRHLVEADLFSSNKNYLSELTGWSEPFGLSGQAIPVTPSWRWTRLKIMPLVANKAVKVASNFINLCHSWVTKSTETKVYDVRWHPTHPACFASTDGEGQRTQSEHGCMMAHFNGFQSVSKVSKVSKYVVILSSVMNTCCCTCIYMRYMLYTAQPWA